MLLPPPPLSQTVTPSRIPLECDVLYGRPLGGIKTVVSKYTNAYLPFLCLISQRCPSLSQLCILHIPHNFHNRIVIDSPYFHYLCFCLICIFCFPYFDHGVKCIMLYIITRRPTGHLCLFYLTLCGNFSTMILMEGGQSHLPTTANSGTNSLHLNKSLYAKIET